MVKSDNSKQMGKMLGKNNISKRANYKAGKEKIKKPVAMKAVTGVMTIVAIKNTCEGIKHKRANNQLKEMQWENGHDTEIRNNDSISEIVRKLEQKDLEKKIAKLNEKFADRRNRPINKMIGRMLNTAQQYARTNNIKNMTAINEGRTSGINDRDVPSSSRVNRQDSDIYNILSKDVINDNVSFEY